MPPDTVSPHEMPPVNHDNHTPFDDLESGRARLMVAMSELDRQATRSRNFSDQAHMLLRLALFLLAALISIVLFAVEREHIGGYVGFLALAASSTMLAGLLIVSITLSGLALRKGLINMVPPMQAAAHRDSLAQWYQCTIGAFVEASNAQRLACEYKGDRVWASTEALYGAGLLAPVLAFATWIVRDMDATTMNAHISVTILSALLFAAVGGVVFVRLGKIVSRSRSSTLQAPLTERPRRA